MMKSILAVAIALSVPATAALAQDAAAPTVPTAAPVDPARLAAANGVVDHIFPSGTYARIMNGSMDVILKSTTASVGQMSLRDLAGVGGMSEADLAKLGKGTLDDIMAIYDPAYHKRLELGMAAMTKEMTKLMVSFEPSIREGLSEAYAKRFSAEQLSELNRFFATPTGSAYAADSMTLFMDPAVMERMQKAIPEMMKQMPSMINAMQAATADLPKPRQYKDLSKDERARLARLLGISEAQLAKENRK